jgi:hypothetical protein
MTRSEATTNRRSRRKTKVILPLGSPRAQAEQVAENLRSALDGVLQYLGIPATRPGALIAKTGIDKTLAGRIVRTVRAPDALTALQGSPAPEGLRKFLRAVATAGVPARIRARVETAIRGFEAVVSQFAGDRAALDTAIAAWLPRARLQGERDARRWVFKSVSFLLGRYADAAIGATILQPSASGRTCDVVHVQGNVGIRRLRIGEPVAIFGLQQFPTGVPGVPDQVTETLDGERSDQGSAYLLGNYCSGPPIKLSCVQPNESLRLFVLGPDEPSINVPATLVTAQMIRNGWERYADYGNPEAALQIVPRGPTRSFVVDVFLRDDVYPGCKPAVTTHLQTLSSGQPAPRSSPLNRLDQIHLEVEAGWLGQGIKTAAMTEFPRYRQMMEEVFRRVEWDARRFRAFRLRMHHPLPGATITCWFPLPDPPDHADP